MSGSIPAVRVRVECPHLATDEDSLNNTIATSGKAVTVVYVCQAIFGPSGYLVFAEAPSDVLVPMSVSAGSSLTC